MGVRDFSRQITDPNSAHLKRRKAAYALPTLFTAGSVFLGFFSIMNSFQAAIQARSGSTGPNTFSKWRPLPSCGPWCWTGWMGASRGSPTRPAISGGSWTPWPTSSPSGLRPPCWPSPGSPAGHRLGVAAPARLPPPSGNLIPFLYLICGAARLARFNIQKNPVPKNPGRSDRSTSWGCRFQRRRRWWRPLCTPPAVGRSSIGRSRWPGSRCWRCYRS